LKPLWSTAQRDLFRLDEAERGRGTI